MVGGGGNLLFKRNLLFRRNLLFMSRQPGLVGGGGKKSLYTPKKVLFQRELSLFQLFWSPKTSFFRCVEEEKKVLFSVPLFGGVLFFHLLG